MTHLESPSSTPSFNDTPSNVFQSHALQAVYQTTLAVENLLLLPQQLGHAHSESHVGNAAVGGVSFPKDDGMKKPPNKEMVHDAHDEGKKQSRWEGVPSTETTTMAASLATPPSAFHEGSLETVAEYSTGAYKVGKMDQFTNPTSNAFRTETAFGSIGTTAIRSSTEGNLVEHFAEVWPPEPHQYPTSYISVHIRCSWRLFCSHFHSFQYGIMELMRKVDITITIDRVRLFHMHRCSIHMGADERLSELTAFFYIKETLSDNNNIFLTHACAHILQKTKSFPSLMFQSKVTYFFSVIFF